MCDVLREDCEKRGLNSDKHLQYQIANFRPMAQSECIMRFLHVSRADGHIREMEMSQSKESALGWLSLQVEPLRATEFYDGLLRMFNIEPAGGMSCTGVPGRGLLGRQAKTLLTALTRFGLKPDARGGGKWEKGYRGDVPFIYQGEQQLHPRVGFSSPPPFLFHVSLHTFLSLSLSLGLLKWSAQHREHTIASSLVGAPSCAGAANKELHSMESMLITVPRP
jgi:hypothetical protein